MQGERLPNRRHRGGLHGWDPTRAQELHLSAHGVARGATKIETVAYQLGQRAGAADRGQASSS